MNTPETQPPASLGAAHGSDLYDAANTLHLSIATMLKDWRDGDFALPNLATIHMQKIEEDYRALGRALVANSPNAKLCDCD